jgi:hypothetical protein
MMAKYHALLGSSERILDAAIEFTFPASDPIAVQRAFEAACERERDAYQFSGG